VSTLHYNKFTLGPMAQATLVLSKIATVMKTLFLSVTWVRSLYGCWCIMQFALLLGLAYQGKDIVFKFIIEYSSSDEVDERAITV